MPAIRRIVGALLCPAGPAASVPDLPPAAAAALAAIASRHLVAAAVWSGLVERGRTRALPPDVGAYLEAVHGLNAARNARLRSQADEIAALMARSGLESVFLKGTALLLLGTHADPAARFVGDIDLLLAPETAEAAACVLEAAGYRRLPDPGPDAHDRFKLVRGDLPAMVEIHASPLPSGLDLLLPGKAVQAAAMPATPAAARVPCHDHLVVHNVAHAMLHHGLFRHAELPLRDGHDLVALAQAGATDWARVAAALSVAPAGRHALEFQLAACRAVFPGTALPEMPPTPAAARALARWERRGGRAPSAVALTVGNLSDHARAEIRRLRTSPAGRRRAVGRLLDPRFYPRYLKALHHFAVYGPPSTLAGTDRSDR